MKIDELVKPRKAIKDYRTDITGISPGDLDGVSCSLADVQVIVVYFLCGWFTLPSTYTIGYSLFKLQKSITKFLSHGRTILVGHSLNNDLQGNLIMISLLVFPQICRGPYFYFLFHQSSRFMFFNQLLNSRKHVNLFIN